MSEPVCTEPDCTQPADSERPITTDIVELVCHDHAHTDAPQALS